MNKQLFERFPYEFAQWLNHTQFDPEELIFDVDKSEAYSRRELYVFRNRDSTYVVVTKIGCSCYTPTDSDIEVILPDKKSLIIYLNNKDTNSYNGLYREAYLKSIGKIIEE